MKDLTKTKIESIKEKLAGKNVLVAFSGGVDSTVLASIAKESAARTLLLVVTSPTVSEREIESAHLIAGELKADLLVKELDWLSQEDLAQNPMDGYRTGAMDEGSALQNS